MKRHRIIFMVVWAVIELMALPLLTGAAHADQMHVEVILVWATNDERSPDPKHKPVDAELAQKLRKSPYRWKNYFEVSRQKLAIPTGQAKKDIKISEHCTIDLKNLGDNWAEIKFYGDGRLISTHKEELPLTLAGDAKNDTAWLVVIRKVEAAK
jgi:hypothetical protein